MEHIEQANKNLTDEARRRGWLGGALAAGADANAKSHGGATAATLAVPNRNHGMTTLIEAVRLSRKEAIEMANPGVPTGRRGLRV